MSKKTLHTKDKIFETYERKTTNRTSTYKSMTKKVNLLQKYSHV